MCEAVNSAAWIEPWTAEDHQDPQEPVSFQAFENQFSWTEFAKLNDLDNLDTPLTPSNSSEDENNQVSPHKGFVLHFCFSARAFVYICLIS